MNNNKNNNQNKTMNKKTLVLAGIVVVVLVLVIVLSQNMKTAPTAKNTNQGTPTSQNQVGQPTSDVATDVTTAETPVDNPTTVSSNPVVAATLSSMPGSDAAPKQEVVAADKIPAAAIKLSVSDTGFSPKDFTIKAGQEVSLAITGVGSSTHVFIFPMASLMGLQTMVSGGETKVITFTAPNAGNYTFRDDIPMFRENTGTMIVK